MINKSVIYKNRKSFLSGIFLSVLPLLTSSFLGLIVYQFEDQFLQFHLWQWTTFYVITILTMGLGLTPTTFIAMISGYLLGWSSLLGVVPSYLLASLLCYTIARKIDHGTFANSVKRNPKALLFLDRIKDKSTEVVIYSKLSPALPFAISNFLLAIGGVKLRPFLLGGFIGMLPRTVIAVWTGSTVSELKMILEGGQQFENSWSFILIGGLFVISVIGLVRIFKKGTN